MVLSQVVGQSDNLNFQKPRITKNDRIRVIKIMKFILLSKA